MALVALLVSIPAFQGVAISVLSCAVFTSISTPWKLQVKLAGEGGGSGAGEGQPVVHLHAALAHHQCWVQDQLEVEQREVVL